MKVQYVLIGEETIFMQALAKVFNTAFGSVLNKKLYNMQKHIQEEKKYYQESKQKIFNTYGEETGNGTMSIEESTEGLEAFLKLKGEIVEIGFEEPLKIPEKEIDKIKNFTPNDRLILEDIIIFTDEEKEKKEEKPKDKEKECEQ